GDEIRIRVGLEKPRLDARVVDSDADRADGDDQRRYGGGPLQPARQAGGLVRMMRQLGDVRHIQNLTALSPWTACTVSAPRPALTAEQGSSSADPIHPLPTRAFRA